MMPVVTDAAYIQPDDFAAAALMGRIWRPDLASPSVVAIRQDGVFDITNDFPTTSQLAEADPARALRAARGERIGLLQDLLNNTPPDNRDPTRPWLLAPIDLQVIKAGGEFAVSMLERATRSGRAAIRIGDGHPGRGDADRRHRSFPVKAWFGRGAEAQGGAGREREVWRQYLEVAIGPDAEMFTKAPVLSAVGTGVYAGLHEIQLEQSRAGSGARVDRNGRSVGASLGNDVNLRDFEGRSALLLSKAKDNNASCAIGPFMRFFDESFTLDDVRNMTISLKVKGPKDSRLTASR